MSQAPRDLGKLRRAEEFIGREALDSRISEMALEIEKAFEGQDSIAFIAVACGAIVFASDLMRRIRKPMTVDIVFAKSYEGCESAGSVATQVNLRHSLDGRAVLLVDDILDSGRTLAKLSAELRTYKPASLKTCVLLDKPSRRVVEFKADFAGFEIPDVFAVGYGLDLDGYYRNLPYIGKLS
jgi:hypoxanthine phosphoribosyltransferase